jgi:hypothetical protein
VFSPDWRSLIAANRWPRIVRWSSGMASPPSSTPRSEESVLRSEVDAWIGAIANLYSFYCSYPSDSRLATHAAANIWSEYGFLDAQLEVIEMLCHAIEIGYTAALTDIRRGGLGHGDPGVAPGPCIWLVASAGRRFALIGQERPVSPAWSAVVRRLCLRSSARAPLPRDQRF